MMFKRNFNYVFFFLITFLFVTNVSAISFSTNLIPQSGISQNFSNTLCQEGQDFIIQISPFGCTPAVVRTDLLEENNVPVYCKLGATQINPLINVESIDSVSFSGQYSKEVSGVSFHPAKAALGIEGTLNSPVLENIGYVVINLKKQANSSAIPDYISGNLTARIKYNIQNAFGIGKALFYLQEVDDTTWENQKYKSGFWNGKGYLKVDNIEDDNADISIYSSIGKISSFNLKKEATSNTIYLPGFECKAGLKVKLDNIENSDTRALLKINSEIVEVAKGEKFLDNKCEIKSLKSDGFNKQITIKCQEDSGARTFNLNINPKVILNINGEENSYGIGGFLYSQGDRRVYLAYIGTKTNSDKQIDLIAYLAASPSFTGNKLTDGQISSFGSLIEDLNSGGKVNTGIISETNDVLKGIGGGIARLIRLIGKGESIFGLDVTSGIKDIYGQGVSLIGYAEAQDIELIGDNLLYYENAKADYEKVRQQYSSEEYDGQSSFGEEALLNEIALASSAGQKETAFKLCNELEQNYPDSINLLSECNGYKLSSREIGETYVTINKKIKKLSFEGIFEPSLEDYGVRIILNTPDGKSEYVDLTKNKLVSLGENPSSTEFMQLVSADDDSAKIRVNLVTSGIMGLIQKEFNSDVISLKQDVTKTIGEYSFTLTQIHLKKIAKVSVVPNIDESGAQANFSFKIGIEKRLFQMSPDKIKQTITDLNGTINKWQEISNGLGKTVETLKATCLATGATLIAKNFLTNLGGTGIARQSVMRGINGWFEKCANEVSEKKYASTDQCFNKNADAIDKDVESLNSLISKQNSKIKELEDQHIKPQEFLSEKIIDTNGFMRQYIPQVTNSLVEFSGEDNKEVITGIFSEEGWKMNLYSKDQLREIELYLSVLKDSSSSQQLRDIANSRLESTLSNIGTASETFTKMKSLASSAGVTYDRINFVEEKDAKKMSYQGLTNGQLPVAKQIVGVDSTTPVAVILTSNGENYIAVLDDSKKTSQLPVISFYDNDGRIISSSDVPDSLKKVYFERYASTTYTNSFRNAELRYYETEPYKGLPAVVPFDLKDGWYAATKQTLAVGSTIQAFDSSGRVNSFWLCNVGQNGMEEFQIVGDDICQMINLGTGQPYNVFNGLSETQAETLVKKAQSAIIEASRIYKSGLSGDVNILGEKVKVGSPAVDIPQFECQDIMSPKECLLLFNLCDPVICPSSRCDLGGAYPVKDVIQTGVIGSLVLCAPNFREGIIMPVCLTGVQAGIDGFLSVLSGARDCLQESLNTGKTVGICDEIFSVYMCNFFWEQALPISDIIVPKMIEWLLGQNVRGGGEYSGVVTAWNAAESSINYFTNYYGANSKQAFLSRTTEGISEGVCKLFISGVVPSGADFVSTITKPDSPVQFTGRFDEIPFTSATVPATSHYKIFYHIFAGKDSGAYYQVYLKGNYESSYYQDTASNINIASGYIAVGSYASETVDKIATSGYRELCLSVNGQEECGFGEVSTSFALNYIEDKYLEDQASQTEITTENECISGTTSAYSLLDLNVQSSVENLIDPSIYNKGIIRICATDNPGKGTDPSAGIENSRWKNVGYCGDEKIKCWIDTESVGEVIKTTTVEGQALTEITENYITQLRKDEGYFSEEEVAIKLDEIKKEEDPTKRIDLIELIIEKVFTNKEKATLFSLRGESYWELLKDSLAKTPLVPVSALDSATTDDSSAEIKISTTSSEPEINSKETIVPVPTELSSARQKVLSAVKSLEGKDASRFANCWDAAYYVYTTAKVGDVCSYSDKVGKKYSFLNELTKKTVSITTESPSSSFIVKWLTYGDFWVYNCPNTDFSETKKLDGLLPGDLLSLAWDGKQGHNVIFINWIDKSKKIANVFDWNGGKAKSIGGNTFRYFEANIGDNSHPIYVYWSPVEKK